MHLFETTQKQLFNCFHWEKKIAVHFSMKTLFFLLTIHWIVIETIKVGTTKMALRKQSYFCEFTAIGSGYVFEPSLVQLLLLCLGFLFFFFSYLCNIQEVGKSWVPETGLLFIAGSVCTYICICMHAFRHIYIKSSYSPLPLLSILCPCLCFSSETQK